MRRGQEGVCGMSLTVILLAVIAVLLICLVVLALRLRRGTAAGGAPAPLAGDAGADVRDFRYRRKTYLLTRQEQHFYRALAETALELNLHLFVKVRLADIIGPVEGTEGWDAFLARIGSRKVDFLLCRDTALSPVLVVELDDQTHNWQRHAERDNLKEKALMEAGLGVLHVKSAAGLRGKVAAMLPPAGDMDYPSILGPGATEELL